MKKCLKCGACHDSGLPNCPSCQSGPAVIDGFFAYAPELAAGGAGFPEDGFAQLAQCEADSFWFRARNKLLVHMLRKHAPAMTSFMEIGCGTGFVLADVAKAFPQAALTGSEVFCTGLAFAKQRNPAATLVQMDARRIPFINEFDAVGAFDVLEHIAEDELVLREVFAALRPGGLFFATVPQHQWLWSKTDEVACHVRRYEPGELERKATLAGFTVLESTSFVSLLLPLMWLSRKRNHSGEGELRISPVINRILEFCMSLERIGILWGLRYPAGGSRLIVARKQNQDIAKDTDERNNSRHP